MSFGYRQMWVYYCKAQVKRRTGPDLKSQPAGQVHHERNILGLGHIICTLQQPQSYPLYLRHLSQNVKSSHSWAAHNLGLGQMQTNHTDLDEVTCISGAQFTFLSNENATIGLSHAWTRRLFLTLFTSSEPIRLMLPRSIMKMIF